MYTEPGLIADMNALSCWRYPSHMPYPRTSYLDVLDAAEGLVYVERQACDASIHTTCRLGSLPDCHGLKGARHGFAGSDPSQVIYQVKSNEHEAG